MLGGYLRCHRCTRPTPGAGADRLPRWLHATMLALHIGVRRCAIPGVTALGAPSRVGGIPHRRTCAPLIDRGLRGSGRSPRPGRCHAVCPEGVRPARQGPACPRLPQARAWSSPVCRGETRRTPAASLGGSRRARLSGRRQPRGTQSSRGGPRARGGDAGVTLAQEQAPAA
jgi:hypothetical protein